MATRLVRVRDTVFSSREEALAAGFPEAEYGWWVPSNGDTKAAKWGWCPLQEEDEIPDLKFYRCENETYDCNDNAQYVYVTVDGGKTWKGYGWYHLEPYCLRKLSEQGFEEWQPQEAAS